MPAFKIPFKLAFLFLTFAFSPPAFPAPPALPDVQTYDELLRAIRGVQAASQKRIDQAINQEKVREAWETGKLIDTHVLHHKERANYDEQVLAKLALDLKTSQRELYYMLRFARFYPILTAPSKLTWSHYRELVAIEDPHERKKVEEEAVRGNWGHKRVRQEVNRLKGKETPAEILEAKPGKVGTYRVVKASGGPYEGKLALDLGFSTYFQPKEIRKFKVGDLVTLKKGRLKKIEAGEEILFTYNAYVTEIIDGDTFKAVIDLGFKIVTEQKLRLRGLDAPEIESTLGREAKAFLESVIAGGAKQSPVLIKTSKSDKYDRYLADLWVGETYINQELITKGLAVRVNE